MVRLELQDDEADAVEVLLDLILTNKQASEACFTDGNQRRKVKRVSMKLNWARNCVKNLELEG